MSKCFPWRSEQLYCFI